MLDIPLMLTPVTDVIDPCEDFGQKDMLLTNLQFFSQTFTLQFDAM